MFRGGKGLVWHGGVMAGCGWLAIPGLHRQVRKAKPSARVSRIEHCLPTGPESPTHSLHSSYGSYGSSSGLLCSIMAACEYAGIHLLYCIGLIRAIPRVELHSGGKLDIKRCDARHLGKAFRFLFPILLSFGSASL